jgi:hypothetical protein
MSEPYDETAYQNYLAEHKGEYETVFWTGSTDGVGGGDNARAICEEYNANRKDGKKLWKTNEMLLDAAKIEMPEFDPTNQESIDTWESASRATAESASGQVHIIMGKDRHEGSVFNRIERDALNENSNVNQNVNVIDPKSRTHTGTYDKSNLPISRQKSFVDRQR